MTSKEIAASVVLLNDSKFRTDFYLWLMENFHVYQAFERESDRIRAIGRQHYSHRTIWEYLRHETALRERDGEYKLNDHYTKGCALLYSMTHPGAEDFFEFREKRAA